MDEQISRINKTDFPDLLKEIIDPPESLYIKGTLPNDQDHKFLAVVGSRKYSQYGRDVCEKLIHGLAGSPVVIVSGLAIGIDAVAHSASIDANLKTIAVPGSGLNHDVLYPRTNVPLAQRIIETGGALVSEYEPDFRATTWSFPKRNRIMAGLSHAILVIEATEKSGTLVTARLAAEYNRDLLTVPASIFSHHALGSNRLLREGATAIRNSDDILEALAIQADSHTTNTKAMEMLSEKEREIFELLKEPIPRDALIRILGIATSEANILIATMEIKGIIIESLGNVRLK
jgi:DNA processing protein